MTKHDETNAEHLRTARAILETAILQAAAEDPEPGAAVALAVEAGASLRVTVEFPKEGNPTIAASVVMPNGDARDFVRITADPERGH